MSSKEPIHTPLWLAVDALHDASAWLQSWDVGQVEAALGAASDHIREAREALEACDAYSAEPVQGQARETDSESANQGGVK